MVNTAPNEYAKYSLLDRLYQRQTVESGENTAARDSRTGRMGDRTARFAGAQVPEGSIHLPHCSAGEHWQTLSTHTADCEFSRVQSESPSHQSPSTAAEARAFQSASSSHRRSGTTPPGPGHCLCRRSRTQIYCMRLPNICGLVTL